MKHFFKITLFFWIVVSSAQPKLEMSPQGFLPLKVQTPDKPLDKLLEVSKSWASYYNKNGYDVFDVTANTLTIDAINENAFYYYNVGVKYNHDIKYSLKIVFEQEKKYSLTITIKEIYAENVLTKTTVADFFTAEGKLKNDFRDAKPSLENTVNKIVKSFINFIGN